MLSKDKFFLRTWISNLSAGENVRLPILALIMTVVFVLFSILTSGKFLTAANFQSMAFQIPELGLLTLAMVITMLSGGLNLSIISTANLSSIVMALILSRYMDRVPATGITIIVITAAICAAILCSLILGFINGYTIAYVGVSPILATLGTMSLYEGVTLLITKGWAISGFHNSFLLIGKGTLAGVPFSLLLFIVCALGISLMLNRKRLGICIYMVGSNPVATELSGIDTKRILLYTYTVSGLLSGIASVIMVSKYNSANAGYGAGYLLITILIAVLGGISPSGGRGKVSGLVLALIILQFISSGLNLIGVISFITISLWGIVIMLAIWMNNITGARKLR